MFKRVGIFGGGSLGSVIGAVFKLSGVDVTLIGRKSQHLQTVKQKGLCLADRFSESQVNIPVALCEDEPRAPFDLLIILVKTFDTHDAIQQILKCMDDRSVVLTLQNGLGAERILVDALGQDRVVIGRTFIGGDITRPGHVAAGYLNKLTTIGFSDGSDSELLIWIKDLFEASGLQLKISNKIWGTVWDKLLVNVGTGAVSAISGSCYGELYQSEELKHIGCDLIAEGIEVANIKGIELYCADPEEIWISAGLGLPYHFKNSMLQSISSKRKTEIDFINGAVVDVGRKVGVKTPANAVVVDFVRAKESSYLDRRD